MGWMKLPPMPTLRVNFAVGVADTSIIAAGGYNSSGRHNTVDILDMKSRMWKRMSSMNETRCFLGGTVIGDSTDSYHMVLVGGTGFHQSCEVYSFMNDSWSNTTLPDLKSTSNFRQLIAVDGMLIAGGFKNLETLNFCEA